MIGVGLRAYGSSHDYIGCLDVLDLAQHGLSLNRLLHHPRLSVLGLLHHPRLAIRLLQLDWLTVLVDLLLFHFLFIILPIVC